MLRWVAVVWVVALALTSPAHACGLAGTLEEIWPRDGDVDVPTNTHLWIDAVIGQPTTDNLEPWLQTVDGEEVEVELSVLRRGRTLPGARLLVYKPVERLTPNTTYLFNLRARVGGSSGYEVFVTFTTGATADTSAAEASEGLRMYRAGLTDEPWWGSCSGEGDAFDALYADSPDHPYPTLYTIRADYPQGATQEVTRLWTGQHGRVVGSVLSMQDGGTPCMTMEAVDVLGREVAYEPVCMFSDVFEGTRADYQRCWGRVGLPPEGSFEACSPEGGDLANSMDDAESTDDAGCQTTTHRPPYPLLPALLCCLGALGCSLRRTSFRR